MPGVRINLSKSGISTSVGPRGAKVTFGPNGTYVNAGIPGTGLYTREKISGEIVEAPQPVIILQPIIMHLIIPALFLIQTSFRLKENQLVYLVSRTHSTFPF